MRALMPAVVVSCLMSSLAIAQTQRGDWQLTLALTGNSDRDLNDNAVGFAGSIGYYLTDNLDLTLRETLAWSDLAGSSATIATTQIAADWNFHLGNRDQWQPFLGANAAYRYGDLPGDHFVAGPEAGLLYYLNSTTFLYLLGQYQFSLGPNASSADQQFVYTTGIGMHF
jgi:hypothetical protein